MMDDRLWILLGKKSADEATPEELEELSGLLKSGSVNEDSLKLMDRLWGTPLKTLPPNAGEEQLWSRVESAVRAEGKIRKITSGRLVQWLAAACVILAVAFLAFLYRQPASRKSTAQLNQVSTQPGSKSRLELPDGTQVWLNGNSRLTYHAKTFGTKMREVTLTGEAYFDVAANKEVPFIIHAGAINIRVTGTAFNVKAYPSSKVLETALVHGSIEITTSTSPDRKILLKPNEKFVLALDSTQSEKDAKPAAEPPAFSSYSISKLHHQPGEGPVETAWMNSRLVFNEDRFDQLALKLESWYNIRVHFMQEGLKEKKFTGAIERETLEQTMKVLQLSYPFVYRTTGNELWLSEE